MSPALIAVATAVPVALTVVAVIAYVWHPMCGAPNKPGNRSPRWEPHIYDTDDGYTVVTVKITFTNDANTSVSRIRTLKTIDMAAPDWQQQKTEATQQAKDFAAVLNDQRTQQEHLP